MIYQLEICKIYACYLISYNNLYDNSICYKDSPVILPIGGITIQKKIIRCMYKCRKLWCKYSKYKIMLYVNIIFQARISIWL